MPVWKLLLHTQGTCLKGLALDPLIYITMGLYIGLRVYARVSEGDAPLSASMLMNKSDITVLGGFLSFFLVFFVNQTNTRFLEMVRMIYYQMQCNVFCCVIPTNLTFPPQTSIHRLKLIRFLLSFGPCPPLHQFPEVWLFESMQWTYTRCCSISKHTIPPGTCLTNNPSHECGSHRWICRPRRSLLQTSLFRSLQP